MKTVMHVNIEYPLLTSLLLTSITSVNDETFEVEQNTSYNQGWRKQILIGPAISPQ